MKTYTEELSKDLNSKLAALEEEGRDPIIYAEKAIQVTKECLDKLRCHLKGYSFSSKAEEIEFFKISKPHFSSQLIYFNEIYNIEVGKPVGNAKMIKKYYAREELKLKKYYEQHKEFYKYYRTGNAYLDKKYFLRRKQEVKFLLDSHFFEVDDDFTTARDFTVARILANEKIQKFLVNQKANLNPVKIENETAVKTKQTIKWTGSKVALVELLYAIHASEVVNNGELSLNALMLNAEKIFNVNLGQFNRIYLEIKSRKTIEQTSFLNKMKMNLERRMEEANK